jgi:hypothetical protein
MQNVMMKSDYNDEESLPIIIESLEKLKISMTSNNNGKSKK